MGRCISTTLSLLAAIRAAKAAPPNVILVQPDDFPMLEEWSPPNHSPGGSASQIVSIPASMLPNIERLRTEGVQMMQAYTASPKCGTSRYSTLTGRYPSRSSYSREANSLESISEVDIPWTKLQDVSTVHDGKDCSENNLAALLKQNAGYRTGFFGKWHLLDLDDSATTPHNYNYDVVQESIKNCGFDVAKSVYAENLGGEWHDGTFSHNLEYMTSTAIDFITQEEEADDDKPFFLYFNPTAPHSSGDVLQALTDFSCKSTPAGEISNFTSYSVEVDGEQVDVDSTDDCRGYRQTVLDRAGEGVTDNISLGTIWVDDAIGALIQTLKDTNKYENTFFLFQMDHGQEGKATLWEPGIRMAQFIKLPYQKQQQSKKFHGMVSTIDIGPAIRDYAGIKEHQDDETGSYRMDGISWRKALELSLSSSSSSDIVETVWNNNRCLFFEMNQDRAVRCGCYKYMTLVDRSVTTNRGRRRGYHVDGGSIVFNLCNDTDIYDDDQQGPNPESISVADELNDDVVDNLMATLDCHLERTLPSRPPVYAPCGPDTLASIIALDNDDSSLEQPTDALEESGSVEQGPPSDFSGDGESGYPSSGEDPISSGDPSEKLDDHSNNPTHFTCRTRRSFCRPRHSKRRGGCGCCPGLVCRKGRFGGGRYKCRPPLY